jgi:shikimate kinase
LVLVGISGAGKSTVGLCVAQKLGVDAHDIDELIERKEKRPVAEIITTQGEHGFRRLEQLEAERVLVGPPSVVIPGGGWAAYKDNLSSLGRRAISIYMHTTPETALARVGETASRPLLDVPNPLLRIKELLTARLPFYERCDAVVSTEGKTVAEVTDEVIELARRAIVG